MLESKSLEINNNLSDINNNNIIIITLSPLKEDGSLKSEVDLFGCDSKCFLPIVITITEEEEEAPTQLQIIRNNVAKSLHVAAKKSITQSKNKLSNILELGTIVAIKIPSCDLQKLSFKNLLLSIYEYSEEVDKYRLQTLCQTRIVQGYFDKKEFVHVHYNLNISNAAPLDNSFKITTSLRTIVRLDHYKFIGCQCSGRCQNNICFCKKVGKHCNPDLCRHKHKSNCLNRVYVKNVTTRKKCI